MGTETFNLINSDAREHRGPGAIEIARNRNGIEMPHSKACVIAVNDERLSEAGDAECRRQPMRLAGECGKRLGGLGETARLVDDPAFERERLIRAQAIGVRPQRADGERLGPRQLDCQTFERTAGRQMPIFERALVDIGGDNLRVESTADRRAQRL